MAAGKQGFTLIEIIAVLVIMGLAVAFAIFGLIASVEQTKAQQVQNNLLAISAAQQKYFEDNASYCVQVGCGDTKANLNSHLFLSISDSFNYSCLTVAGNIPYNCTATDGTDTLTLNPNAASPASPVTCAGPNNSYCP